MDLSHVAGVLQPGQLPDRLEAALAGWWSRLPDGHRRLLGLADGIALASGGLVYGSADLVERNRTFEVAQWLPDHVAIGDDGGGALVIVRTRPSSPVWRIGAGALGSAEPVELAGSVEAWVARGCPTSVEDDDGDWPATADLYLDVLPEGKLVNLVAIKNGLKLELGMSRLKELAGALPACLARDVPYGKYRQRCEALNRRFGPCVSLRTRPS